MTVEKLWRKFTGDKKVSPNRAMSIRRATNLTPTEDVDKENLFKSENQEIQYVLDNLDPTVKSKLVSKKKVERFSKTILRMLGQYTAKQLSKIDAECLNDNGGIDKKGLNEILYDE